MQKHLLVFLHDVYTGKLFSMDGKLCFANDEQYLKRGDARAIASTMPLTNEIFPHQMVFPFFQDYYRMKECVIVWQNICIYQIKIFFHY